MFTPNQALLHWRERKPDAVAVRFDGRTYGWARVAEHVARFAAALHEAGLRGHHVVGIQCADPPLALLIMLAAETIGAPHAHLKAHDLHASDIVAANCSVLIGEAVSKPLRENQIAIRLDSAGLKRILARPVDGAMLARLAQASPPQTQVRLGRTSGTTGTAKIMANRRSLVTAALASMDDAYRPIDDSHEYLCLFPLGVRAIYLDVARALIRGCPVRFLKPEDVPSLERTSHCWAYLLPGIAAELATACRSRGAFLDLHYVNVFGSRLSAALHRELSATLSRHVLNPYSSNEANNIAMSRPEGPGLVTPGMEVMICDDAMRALPHGEIGAIAVRGARVIDRYLANPDLNARQFRDGWFLMNDLGRMPAPGQLEVLGRADDMLNVAGLKMLPYPLEATLRQLPTVSDAAVLQSRDHLGIGRLLVVLEAGDAALAKDRVEALMRSCLPPAVGDIVVHRIPAFPRTATGKLQRRELAAQIAHEQTARRA